MSLERRGGADKRGGHKHKAYGGVGGKQLKSWEAGIDVGDKGPEQELPRTCCSPLSPRPELQLQKLRRRGGTKFSSVV